MKIAKIILISENGEEVALTTAPFWGCNIGSCEIHGSDDIYAFCPGCRQIVCAGHWDEAAGLCQYCAARARRSATTAPTGTPATP